MKTNTTTAPPPRYKVGYDKENHIVIATWNGYQTTTSIKDGGKAILKALKDFNCDTLLNDNSKVLGTWFHSFDWAINEWFPQLVKSGIKTFAWAMSPDSMSLRASRQVMSEIDPSESLIKGFDPSDKAVKDAMAWILNRKNIK